MGMPDAHNVHMNTMRQRMFWLATAALLLACAFADATLMTAALLTWVLIVVYTIGRIKYKK